MTITQTIAAASFLESNGIPLAIVCAVVGLAFAIYLIRVIMALPAGNEKMREIAEAVQEGAKAYLGRQLRAVSTIAVVVTINSPLPSSWVQAPAYAMVEQVMRPVAIRDRGPHAWSS